MHAFFERLRFGSALLAFAAPLTWVAPGALAAVTISSGATYKMTCSGGVCTPTAKNAVLNVGDLESLLASGNVTVTTTGARNKQADNIVVAAALSWTASNSLTLDAFQSVTIDSSVAVNGPGGLTIVTDDGGMGGTFSVGMNNSVVFQNLSSQLTINGAPYALVNNVASLASEVANDATGNFALANNYDASVDGTYPSAPVAFLNGNFEGLGNTISNLTIADSTDGAVALFAVVYELGAVRDLGLLNANVTFNNSEYGALVGALAAQNDGSISNVFVRGGSVVATYEYADIGGLVGINFGGITDSGASANVSAGVNSYGGGLVGNTSESGISNSYATGAVTGSSSGNAISDLGGLVGGGGNSFLTNSYATGAVTGGGTGQEAVGGLIGAWGGGNVETSYSTGAVSGTGNVGGFIGDGGGVHCYWDTQTSGTDQGTGNNGNVRGVTGLTTAQFQSGLPKGFKAKVWGENSNVNGGFPYLLALPPS